MRALIFDFDGLIVDTESTALASWRELYDAHGEQLPLDRWTTTIGTWHADWEPAADLGMRIGRPLTSAELAARSAREAELAELQPALPGVVAHIDAGVRRGLALGIASSSSRRWVVGHLRRLGLLDLFECVYTRDDVERTKPDPALFVLALECLGVSAEEALAYEDSALGVAAAKAAGLKVVAVPGPLTRGSDLSAADIVLGSLSEVSAERLWQQVSRLG